MAYTVKQVSAISGVSVRTLHFYDESSLLKPAYHGANGYRYYDVSRGQKGGHFRGERGPVQRLRSGACIEALRM